MQKIALLLSITALLASCKNSETEKSTDSIELNTPKMIAFAHGLEKWENVSQIKFTFNVERDENHYERSWLWNPKTKDITRYTKEDTISYNQNKMDSIALQVDKNFINDKYWLLAPLNLADDDNFTFTTKDSIIAPISKKPMQQLTVVYDNQGGYTPGDAYDFYFENDFIIKEWVYRRGNEPTPGITATWENYQDHQGIKIATHHQTSDGAFKLYFTNIDVKTTDD